MPVTGFLISAMLWFLSVSISSSLFLRLYSVTSPFLCRPFEKACVDRYTFNSTTNYCTIIRQLNQVGACAPGSRSRGSRCGALLGLPARDTDEFCYVFPTLQLSYDKMISKV